VQANLEGKMRNGSGFSFLSNQSAASLPPFSNLYDDALSIHSDLQSTQGQSPDPPFTCCNE